MSWFRKLKNGLKSSSDKISDGVSGIFSKDEAQEAPETTEETTESAEPQIVEKASIQAEAAPIEEKPQEKPVEQPAPPSKKTIKKKSSGGIAGFFTKRRLDESVLQDLEDLLITADLGVDAATEIVEKLRADKFDKDITEEEIKEFLAAEITEILEPVTKPLEVYANPQVVLVVGVNGNGKTTSIGKIANHFREEGKSVIIGAADTFRAAAVEQLAEWAKRAKVPMYKGAENQDPASVCYQTIDYALKENIQLVLIDTAGRLQNKHNLMQELEKISNVCRKQVLNAPHEIILVLDATTGQNALSQVEEFQKASNVTGLIVTKLDGTAKGGVVVALAKKFEINIHAIGVGEGIEDLKPFDANEFAKNLVGL